MTRKTAYLFFSFLLTLQIFAQKPTKDGYDYVVEDEDYVLSSDALKTRDKIHYGFEMGVGFGQSRIYGDYFTSYYSPQISYDVSPKFSINTGITYMNSVVNDLPTISDYRYQTFSGNIAQYYAFVEGRYKLTDKLFVGGSIFYDATSYKFPDGKSIAGGSGLDNFGGSAYFEYKVNKSLSIYGEIRVNDKNPYRQGNSSFSNGFMGGQTSFFR